MSQELKQGTKLQKGKYIIKQVLGKGGFGITYLAEQVSLGREVAIKEFFMKNKCARDEVTKSVTMTTIGSSAQTSKYREEFIKEASNLAKLKHPHIVNIFEVFEENDTSYYVMPYITGGSLVNCRNLSEKRALRYIGQVAKAVQYMHNNNMCHYDIKPSNILLDAQDNAVLIDFGISKHYDSEGHETAATNIGISRGYAPIEQYGGMAPTFSPASDVYALGATLYYLVMGKKPPESTLLSAGASLSIDSKISPVIRALILKSMTLDPNKRPQKVDMFINVDLTPVRSTPVPAPKTSPKPRIQWKCFFKKTKRIIKRFLLFVVLGAIIIFFLHWLNHNKGIKLPYDPIVKLEEDMTYVEGGKFMMGATPEQGNDAEDDERPAHETDVKDFYICKYEVTQGLWKAVMGDNPSRHQGDIFNLFNGDLERPVECVSWESCQKFIVALSQLTGHHFRLLTEREWEYAARGGKQSKRFKYSGSNYVYEVAWYDMNSDGDTHTVGTKKPNELGLYDMNGNVDEWCQDIADLSDNTIGDYHIMRGGSMVKNAKSCRVSKRDCKEYSDYDCGLRLAADVPFTKKEPPKASPSWWEKNSPQWLNDLIVWIFY